MKKSKALLLVIGLLSIFTLSSCSTTQTFLTSSVVPAANGTVKINKDDNSNYAINVKVTNLAEPSRLTPKKKYYIVWLVTKNNITRNIGQLKSSSGFFSSALEGKLSTVSVLQPDYIYITAENETQIQYPVGTVVLTTK